MLLLSSFFYACSTSTSLTKYIYNDTDQIIIAKVYLSNTSAKDSFYIKPQQSYNIFYSGDRDKEGVSGNCADQIDSILFQVEDGRRVNKDPLLNENWQKSALDGRNSSITECFFNVEQSDLQ